MALGGCLLMIVETLELEQKTQSLFCTQPLPMLDQALLP
jgi:hypothetical protein